MKLLKPFIKVIAEAMKLTVNGETMDFEDGLSVTGLLAALGLPVKKIAVERNLEVVPRSLFDETVLAEADRIEIVQFVGGG